MDMKRALALAVVGLSAASLALPARYLYETQALTRAAPTLSSEGMGLGQVGNLPAVRGVRVSVCAASGQTLSGAGTLRAWVYHADAALWMRNVSLDLKVDATAVRCQAFPDLVSGARLEHRVLWAADGITVSGGTTVEVRIDADLSL